MIGPSPQPEAVDRLALVIGSQYEAALRGPNQLPFLPAGRSPADVELAGTPLVSLAEALFNPAIGAWSPVEVPDVSGFVRPGLLVNPTVGEAKAALLSALHAAAEASATLLFYFTGHGVMSATAGRAPQHLLKVWDTVPEPTAADSHRAFRPYSIIKDELPAIMRRIRGLLVVVDACFGSSAIPEVNEWRDPGGEGVRFGWLASSADTEAFNGCMTEQLAAVLQEGVLRDVRGQEFRNLRLLCGDVVGLVGSLCPGQVPVWDPYQAHATARDEALWLARNRARTSSESMTDAATSEASASLLEDYVPFWREQLAAKLQVERVVCVQGPAGSGKSALLAAAHDEGLVDGLLFASQAGSDERAATTLSVQLQDIDGFPEAAKLFELRNTDRWNEFGALDRLVLGPIEMLNQRSFVLAIDGLDQLDPASPLRPALATAQTNPDLQHVRWVLSSRHSQDCAGATLLVIGTPDDEVLGRYAEQRGVPAELIPNVVNLGGGSWLVTRLACDTVSEGGKLPDQRAGLYAGFVDQVKQRWGEAGSAVLSVLAATEPGPVLPFTVLIDAAARPGGPNSAPQLLSLLADPALYPLVVRAEPGTSNEQVGFFHATVSEDLDRLDAVDITAGHLAIVEALDQLTPADQHNAQSRSQAAFAYAEVFAPTHLAALGRWEEIPQSLAKRESPVPQENLKRWTQTLPQLEQHLGPDHADTLTTRHGIAHWTGEAGDSREALRLSQELLSDQERILDAHHPDTLATRHGIAHWTGQVGDSREALRLSQELLPDRERVLRADHTDTLSTRHEIASWTGEVGDSREALRLFRELLPDQERILGTDHPDTLTTRGNIPYWTGVTGDAAEALHLLEELLPDLERVLGKDHPETLATRGNIASWTGKTGDAAEALRLFQKLLPDQKGILGADHPDTLATRSNIAGWTGTVGDIRKALPLFQDLLPDVERVLGRDHPEALATRGNIAFWSAIVGDIREALRLFQELLPDVERVFRADHPNTLTTLSNIATWTGNAGDSQQALRLHQELLPDRERVLGADHPDTLRTRNNIASWTGKTGDAAEALRLSQELLPDQERVLGADHPDTLNTRDTIAFLTDHVAEGGDDGDTEARR